MTELRHSAAIDCWVNPFTPEIAGTQRPEFLVRVATDYFHRADEVFKGTPLDEMVGLMKASGIAAGLLTIDAANPGLMAEAAAQYGGRFLLSAVVDPTQGMQAADLRDTHPLLQWWISETPTHSWSGGSPRHPPTLAAVDLRDTHSCSGGRKAATTSLC